MKRKICILSSVLLALLCFWSCTDNDDGVNSSAMVQIYGRKYSLASGMIWKSNSYTVYSSVPYFYKYAYINDKGEEVTNNVEGFTLGKDEIKTGNFMLSLYEDGLVFNEGLQAVKGKGACICFHLSSPDQESIASGKYVFENGKKPNTFVGYVASEYNTTAQNSSETVPAEISEGEVTVKKEGNNYQISFVCKTTFGGEISGEYRGRLDECRVKQDMSTFLQDLSLAGLMEVVHLTSVIGDDMEVIDYLDTKYGAAFLSSAKGVCQRANVGGKDLIDIALVWDRKRECFYFESPIRMVRFLGHDSNYIFPCNTIYMRAPKTFTDADYEKLGETGFEFDIQEEQVEFSAADFEPGYVFFKAGNGMQGVIHVKGYVPMGESTTTYLPDFWYEVMEVNPVLKVDVKCPANFVNPKIR